jgi:hypothetical protein
MEGFKSNSTEAPASATLSITSKDGFDILFTIRKDSGNELLDALKSLGPQLVAKGYKPQEKRSYKGVSKPTEYVPNRVCPLCTQPLVYATTKDGKRLIKCSTNKWDFTNKQVIGCKFIEWPNQPTIPDITVNY